VWLFIRILVNSCCEQNLLTTWTTLEIPTKFLHLNQFENSPMKKHLFLPFDMVSGIAYMSFHLLGVSYLIYFSIYSIIMALCKTCDMPNCLHCAHSSSCHKYIQSPNDSLCCSNQQLPKTSAWFTCSACVSSTIPFFNLTNTELYNLLLFDNSDLSNFIESFPCDLSAQIFQTKYSTLSETDEMNHTSKQKNVSYFHFTVRSLGKK